MRRKKKKKHEARNRELFPTSPRGRYGSAAAAPGAQVLGAGESSQVTVLARRLQIRMVMLWEVHSGDGEESCSADPGPLAFSGAF